MTSPRTRRLAVLALAAAVVATVIRLATADSGGVYDPEETR